SYRVWLSVSKAGRRMENPSVVRTRTTICKVLSIQRCSYCRYQRCPVIDVNVHRTVPVVGIPGPPLNRIAALTVVTAVEAGLETALYRSVGIVQKRVSACKLDDDVVDGAVPQ